MSEVLKGTVKVFQQNAQKSLKELSSDFDLLERKARCCYFVGQVVSNSKDTVGKVSPLFEEIFIDLVQSISACLHGQYRLAYQSLRSALELTVAATYFADHPVEFSQWKNDDWDFQFSLIKEVLSESYSKALGVDKVPVLGPIQELYRFLSQFVHGKYGYMTAAQDGPVLHYAADKSREFYNVFNDVFTGIINLLNYRFDSFFPEAYANYPFLKTILQVD